MRLTLGEIAPFLAPKGPGTEVGIKEQFRRSKVPLK